MRSGIATCGIVFCPSCLNTSPGELEISWFCSRLLTIMQTLLGLFICLVLVNTGTSLDCEVCTSLGTSCAGEIETCTDGRDTCVVALSDTSLDGYVTKTILKSCAYSKICTNKTQYVEYGTEISQRSGFACCQGDSCHTALPELSKPLNKTHRNGKHCPACFSFLSSTCKEDEMVECRGPEDHCVDVEGFIIYGSIVLKMIQRGCVTKEICADLSLNEMKVSGIHVGVTKALCKEATLKQPPSSDQPQEINPKPSPPRLE